MKDHSCNNYLAASKVPFRGFRGYLTMKIKFLGTGTSTGNPELLCKCEVCTSNDIRDKRLRASALIEVQGRNILIDCGPDFRMQMLNTGIDRLDGVLITHEHYDHVGGIDDLRPFCKIAPVRLYAENYVAEAIKLRIPYVFKENKYPGVPDIKLHVIEEDKPFCIEDVEIIPIRLLHGKLPILGYRIGNMAYLTDLKYIPEEEFEKLKNLDVLIISALRPQEHISHQTIESALLNIEKINPKQAYLIHMSHHFGLHALMEKQMPEKVTIAYDGLEL